MLRAGRRAAEFRSLLVGLANDDEEITLQSLDLMLSVGRSTGASLVLGALIALTSLSPRD